MALDGVSWVQGGLVETALATLGLAVRWNPRRPLLPPSGHAPPGSWSIVLRFCDLRSQAWRSKNSGDSKTLLRPMASLLNELRNPGRMLPTRPQYHQFPRFCNSSCLTDGFQLILSPSQSSR
jgi:hypothetical protein